MALINVKKTVPVVATNVVTVPGAKNIVVNWEPSSNVSDQYQVYRSLTNDDLTSTKIATVQTNSYTDSDIISNQNYFYWVKVVNSFGTESEYSTYGTNPRLGVNFSQLFMSISVIAFDTLTSSIQHISGKAYWTTSTGAIGSNSSFMSFITPVVVAAAGEVNWTNPSNVLVDDTSYATCALTAGESSYRLRLDMGDLQVPDDAILTGLEIQVKHKATMSGFNMLLRGIMADGDGAGANGFGDYKYTLLTADNVDETSVLGSSTDTWSIGATGVPTASAVISSADVATITSVTSAGVSVSSSAGTPTVSSYATWYEAGYAGFTAEVNSIVTLNMYMVTTTSAISSSGVQVLTVYHRLRLRDMTLGVDVDGGTKDIVVLQTFGGTTWGPLASLSSFSESYVAGFRGLLVGGHDYRLYMECMKKQTSGSPTATLTINTGAVISSGASIVS